MMALERIALDRIILTAANTARCLYRQSGHFYPRRPSFGLSFQVEPVERLADRGRLQWMSPMKRNAVITDLGRQELEAPPPEPPALDAHTTCQLCGQPSRLSLALLKRPWSDDTVEVKACTPCARVAWKTLELIGKSKLESGL
jgi:hypothetical protein